MRKLFALTAALALLCLGGLPDGAREDRGPSEGSRDGLQYLGF